MGTTVQADQVSDLDLDAIFSGGDSDLPIEAEGLFECKNPHWIVSRDGLRKILKIIFSFPSKLTVFMAVWKEGSTIRFHANNRDALIDAELPLQNENPHETSRVYFLDTVKLLAFVNSYNQFALSFDPDDTIFYESPYVRYKLDTVKLSLDDVRIKYEPISTGAWMKFPLSKNEVGVFKALYGFAVRLSDSKILIDSEHGEAFYTLYKYSVISPSKLNERVILRRLDLSTLREIIEEEILFYFTKDRLFFNFGIGVVSFLRVPYDEGSFMYPDTFLTGESLGSYDLDVPLLKRALKLSTLFHAEELVFSTVDLDVYMTVSERAKFKVGSVKSGVQSASSFNVGVETFSNLLSTVNGSLLSVSVSEYGIQLACDDRRGVYSMARASMSQLKQGKLPPVLSTPSPTVLKTDQVDFQDAEVL